jgi:Zn-dependent protease
VVRNRAASRLSPIFLGILAVTIVGGVICGLAELGTGLATFGTILLILGGWAVSLCLHEFGHAFVALKGGDYSVRHKGYLNLDPRRYTDPVFSLLLPLLFLLIGGLPLPGGAVWINHGMIHKRGMRSLVSLAGPLSNLVIGILLAVISSVIWPDAAFDPFTGIVSGNVLQSALAALGLLQIVAFILNILPIPGLDGWGALEPYLSAEAREFGAKVRPWAPLVLFALLIAIRPLSGYLFDAAGWVFALFGGDTGAAGLGLSAFQLLHL